MFEALPLEELMQGLPIEESFQNAPEVTQANDLPKAPSSDLNGQTEQIYATTLTTSPTTPSNDVQVINLVIWWSSIQSNDVQALNIIVVWQSSIYYLLKFHAR